MFGKQNNPLNGCLTGTSGYPGRLGLLLLPALLVVTSGCRVPGQRSFANNEPSFDQLLEIERAQSPQRRIPLAQSKRPGRSAQAMPISLAAQDEIQLDEMQLSPDDSPEHKLLLQTEIALRNSKNLNRSAKTSSERFAQSKMASRTISDFTDEPEPRVEDMARASAKTDFDRTEFEDKSEFEDTVAYKMSDRDTLERVRDDATGDLSPSTESLASYSQSSRRGETPDAAVRTASYEGTESHERSDSAVRHASASRSRDMDEENFDVSFENRRDLQSPELTWEDHLRAAIVDLEATNDASLSPEIRLRKSVSSKFLYVMLGELDAAMRPIDGLQPHEQEYLQHELQAISDLIDPEGNPVSSRRWSLIMLSQRKAMEHLAAVSNLEVSNAAFCTEVESFGVVTKFAEYKFQPDQELLLYCELDNFVSESVKNGFETQLQGSYEIVDSNGRRLADQLLPMDSHICRNRRRDYFIAYRMYMPQNVDPGNYTLKLTIEDMKGRKYGQAELDFQIVN